MSKQDYNDKLKEITAIPEKQVNKINIPVGEAVQEA